MNCLKVIWKFAVVLCGATIFLGRAAGGTIMLRPVADAEIQQAAPNTNVGADPTMVSGALGPIANAALRRAFLRFDLTGSIPPGAIVNSASLTVSVVFRLPAGSPVNSTFDLRRILQPWSESSVSWNSRMPATPWQVPGATGAADSVASASSSVLVSRLGSYTFLSSARMVADVQAWVANPGTNFGWLLISENEATAKTARHFGTRENANNAAALVIDYALPPTISLQPASQTVSEGDTVTNFVQAAGTPPLSYQWQINTRDIPGQTNNSLVLDNVQTSDSGSYTVIVSNLVGFVVSQPATLDVLPRSAFQPRVALTSPTNGTLFPIRSSMALEAEATVSDFVSNAAIRQIEFFANALSVGTVTNNPARLVLSNLAVGAYILTARATDTRTNVGISTNLVAIRILSPPFPTLVAPEPGARIALGSSVAVSATLSPPALPTDIERVQFFANGSFIGESLSASSNLFSFTWTPTVANDFVLTSVATDTLGQTGVSSPVRTRVYIPELNNPTVAITRAPPNFYRQTTNVVTLSGIASDDIGLDHVELQVDHGPSLEVPGKLILADGTTNWTATNIMLFPGNNSIHVRSVDLARNVSLDAVRYIDYVVTDSLTLKISGSGTVTPNLTDRPLEIGRLYAIKAAPDPGFVFAGWDFGGSVQAGNSNQAILSFVMQSNLVLTANFTGNPFAAVNGNYSGLFYNLNAPSPKSSGFLSLQIGRLGTFSGKLVTGGQRFSFRGLFDNDLHANVFVPRRRLAPISMTLDLDSVAGELRGNLTNSLWTAELLGYRNAVQFLSPPAAQAGSYQFRFETEDGVVVGDSSARISASGWVRYRGRLDGRKFSMASSINENSESPFYVSPKGGNECIIGWLNFPANQIMSHGTNVFWVRSATNTLPIRLEAVPD